MLFSNVFNRFNVLTALSCFVPVWRSMSFRLGLDEHKVRGEHHQVTWEKPPGQTQALFEQWRDESSELWGARWVRWCPLSGCQCFTVSAPGLLDLQTAADPSKAVPCESSWWSWEFDTHTQVIQANEDTDSFLLLIQSCFPSFPFFCFSNLMCPHVLYFKWICASATYGNLPHTHWTRRQEFSSNSR